MFSKKDLKTGMFGVMDNNQRFVVVGNSLIYQDGNFDYVSDLNEDMSFTFRKVDLVYDRCCSFNRLDKYLHSTSHCMVKPIYDRNKPEYYNGKVVCIDVGSLACHFTKGKIYEFKDGVGFGDTGVEITNGPVKDFDDLSHRFMYTIFIPLVED